MSDTEEPATKMSKLDEEHLELMDEMEEGQEEWLSEEILTDEDYNTAAEHDNDQSMSTANTSKEDSMDPAPQDAEQQDVASNQNIEETLNNFENSRSNDQTDNMSEELSAFLVKKAGGSTAHEKQEGHDDESDLDQSTKQSDDDGNDTDDLLRMLGDDSKKKENPATKQSQIIKHHRQLQVDHQSSDDDDEGYIYEGAKVTKLKIAKDALINETQVKRLKVAKGAFIQKKIASKAEPEDLSDKEDEHEMTTKVVQSKTVKMVAKRPVSKAVSEDFSDFDEDSVPSSDEAMTVKRMFGVRQSGSVAGRGPHVVRRGGINAVKTVTKRAVTIEPKQGSKQLEVKPPLKQSTMRVVYRAGPSSVKKEIHTDIDEEEHLDEIEEKPIIKSSHRAAPPAVKRETTPQLHDERHSDEDSMDMGSDEEKDGQRLMKPERMDEDIPSDADSNSEADSYYDELPTTDSEEGEDWFTLDLRAERAADYLPLLGANAHSLLIAEQQRASRQLSSLRQSARALCAGRRALASQLRIARQALAHLDAALTAH